MVGHTDRITRHVVHEKIGEMFGGDHHECIGPRGLERLAHLPVICIECFAHRGFREFRPRDDAGRVAANAGEHEAHSPATFSSVRDVIAYTPARTGPYLRTPSRMPSR